MQTGLVARGRDLGMPSPLAKALAHANVTLVCKGAYEGATVNNFYYDGGGASEGLPRASSSGSSAAGHAFPGRGRGGRGRGGRGRAQHLLHATAHETSFAHDDY